MPGNLGLSREQTKSVRISHYDSQKHTLKDRVTLHRQDRRGAGAGLHDNLGPFLHLLRVKFPGTNSTAISREEDGSGYACYLSGNKAVVINSHHKNRRFSALIYDDVVDRFGQAKLLGTFTEWGIGEVFERAKPFDGSGRGCIQRSYRVTDKSVTVTTDTGQEKKFPRRKMGAAVPQIKASGEPLELALNESLTVRLDKVTGLTVVDFCADGVDHQFWLGEVASQNPKLYEPADAPGQSSFTATTPKGILGHVKLQSQKTLSNTRDGLHSTHQAISQHEMTPWTTLKRDELKRSDKHNNRIVHGLSASASTPTMRPGGANTLHNTGTISLLSERTVDKHHNPLATTQDLQATQRTDEPLLEKLDRENKQKAAESMNQSLARLKYLAWPGKSDPSEFPGACAPRDIAEPRVLTGNEQEWLPSKGEKSPPLWFYDHELKRHIREENPSLPRMHKEIVGPKHNLGGIRQWSGKLQPPLPVGGGVDWSKSGKIAHPTEGLLGWHDPVGRDTEDPQQFLPWNEGLRRVRCDDLEEEVRRFSSQQKVLVVICTAIWAKQSAQALRSARSTMSHLAHKIRSARGDPSYPLPFEIVQVELSEAGSVISEMDLGLPGGGRSEPRGRNKLVAQLSKDAGSATKWLQSKGDSSQGMFAPPWLLVYSKGECVMSRKFPGFVARLRYPTLSRPRVLLVEPISFSRNPAFANEIGPHGHVKPVHAAANQLVSENTLRLMQRSYDLATSVEEAAKFLGGSTLNHSKTPGGGELKNPRTQAKETPPYGILMVAASVGGDAIERLVTLARRKNSETVVVVMHHPEHERPDDSLNKLTVGVKRREELRERETKEAQLEEFERGVVTLNPRKLPKRDLQPVDPVQVCDCRPIHKAYLQEQLLDYECVYTNYDEVGISAALEAGSGVQGSKFYTQDDAYLNFVQIIEDNLLV